jgi:tRNA pseudouridine13 synthase
MKTKQIPEDFAVEELIELPELKENGYQTYFWLTKKNWTTEAAIRAISRACNTSQRRFKFAGSKDKIAVTKQLVSAFKIPAEVLQRIKLKDISIDIIGFGDAPISLGTLKGNRFEIIVRDLSTKEISKLKKNFARIRKSGFRNYFGEQRFGKGNTHIIGKYILQERLEEAAREIICFAGEKEREDVKAAKKFAAENWRAWEKILERFPRHLYLESDLLSWLAKPNNQNDFAGALRVLPKHIRKLYVHAYQSWLWNSALSKLKTAKGNLPVPGFATKLSKDSFSQTIKRLLEKDNLTLESFHCKRMPEIAVAGELRKAVIKPTGFKIYVAENDELNKDKQKLKLSFNLPKGCYATVLLEELQAAG